MKLQLNESFHLTVIFFMILPQFDLKVMFLYDSPPAKGELEGVAQLPLIPPL